MKDFKKMKENQPAEMAKGLGSNVGDAKWTEAKEKKERLLKFAAETKQRMQWQKQ